MKHEAATSTGLSTVEPIVTHRWEKWIASAIITAFGLLAVAYSLGPIFEPQDEMSHYRLTRFMLETRGLPGKVWDPASSDQSDQAPLYHIIGAIISSPFPDSDFEQNYFQRSHKNLSAGYEVLEPNNDNKNVRFHWSYEAFPYSASETAFVAHLLRLYSVALAIGTMVVAYQIFRILFPARPDRRLVALAMIAFWPQILYVSASITNDNMVYFMGTLSLFLLLRMLRNGPTWRSAIVLGVVLGLTIISKANGTFLAFSVGVAVIADRRLWKYAPVILLLTIAVGGWWYIRNQILYGGLSGYESFWAHSPEFRIEPGEQTFNQWLTRMLVTYDFVWARFGFAEIPVAGAIYRFYDLVAIASVAGFGVWLYRNYPRVRGKEIHPTRVLMVAVMAVNALSWVAALGYVATVEWWGVHARHYLPGMAAWGALVATGLDIWTPVRMRLRVALSQAAVFAVMPAVCLFGFILPAYQVSPAPATIAHPLSYTYEDAAELIGIDQPDIHVHPGDKLYITLYWRAIKPTDTGLMAYLHTVGSNVVKRDSVPGTGNLPSTEWQPGQTWAERYYVVVPDDAEPQRTYPLIAGLQNPDEKKEPLEVVGPEGPTDLPVIGRVTVNSQPQPFDPDYTFGGVIGLKEPQIKREGDKLGVCLDWLSLSAAPTDYQVFIHVSTPDNPVAAQGDGQPKAGQFPTSAWLPGEAIHDCIDIDMTGVPPSGWKVAIGLYELVSGARLPAADRAGQPLPDNAVVVTP